MSAFIVEDKTINTVLAFIKTDSAKNAHIYRPLENDIANLTFNTPDALKALGNMMFDLNIRAVEALYGKGQAKKFRPLDYQYAAKLPPSRIQVFKSLKCWLYQCSEGDVPETDLFKAFYEVSGNMAKHIVTRMPEFDAATWG